MHVRTEVTIKASQKAVWEKLTNFSEYPMWNKFITRITGKLKVGEKLSVTIQLPGKKPSTFTPTVSHLNSQNEFRWVGKIFFEWVFKGEHYFRLEAVENTTRITQGEIFSGLLAPLIMRFIGHSTRQGFDLMNDNLKTTIMIDTPHSSHPSITQMMIHRSEDKPTLSNFHDASQSLICPSSSSPRLSSDKGLIQEETPLIPLPSLAQSTEPSLRFRA